MRLLLPAVDRHARARRARGLAGSLALHAAVFALIALTPLDRHSPSRDTAASSVVVAFVPPSDARVEPNDHALSEGHSAATDSAAPLRVAGFNFDVARIRARRNTLFPFLTLDLLFLQGLDEQVRSTRRRLVNPFPPRQPPTVRPPLSLTDAAVQGVIDRSWSRRERWRSFSELAVLISAHDPNEGGVPQLLQRYLDANILQPYYQSTTPDPRFWTILGLAADHADFIDFVRGFARRHPSSRTTTELLFLLDELVQGSRDALLILLDTNPPADLERTRLADRDAYELAVAVQRQYREWLAPRQLDSAGAINARYDEIRLRLLSTIIESTPGGYRAADARYLAGEIFFYQHNTPEAIRWWRAITPDAGDSYAIAYSELLQELKSPSGLSAAEINAILGGERGRWLDASRRRLRQFGHSFTTF